MISASFTSNSKTTNTNREPLSAPGACRAGGLLPARLGEAVQVPVHKVGKGLPGRPHRAGHVAGPDHRQGVSREGQDEVSLIPQQDSKTSQAVLIALAETRLPPLHLVPPKGVRWSDSEIPHLPLGRLPLRQSCCSATKHVQESAGLGVFAAVPARY